MLSPLNDAFDYYLEHQDELVKQHNGKYVVIKNNQVLGAYDSDLQAVEETAKTHEIGTFLVQKCSTDKEDYAAHFHSRVAFA